MDKHSLSPLFNPERIWVLHAADSPELALARELLANRIASGQVRVKTPYAVTTSASKLVNASQSGAEF